MRKYIIWSISLPLGYYLAFQESNLSTIEVLVFGLMMSAFIAFLLFVAVGSVQEYKHRKRLGIDMHAKLETDPEKVKEHMLFIMQHHGIEENLKELNDIFRNYPQWDLSNWEVFRAWYKAQIDHMTARPEIYGMTLKGGLPYNKDEDPLYDPDAPDWEQFDRPHEDAEYFYDEDEEDDDDNDDDDDVFLDNKKDSTSDWIYRGIGFGAVNSIFSGSGNSGSNSN